MNIGPNKQPNGVRDIDELAQMLGYAKAQGKKVVHCHGVFDLLHIGHIRHLEEAKQLGDLLVVTVTPDRYVNKGPSRPAFNETLRAEAIAALDCVDHVAINRWPMATETIQLLRPDFYVKGSEYREDEKDLTGGITLEAQAVKSVGGSLVFTDDITFSSSNLINRHLPVLDKDASDYLAGFSSRYSDTDIIGVLDRMRPLKVLVVGEAIIDEYQYCQAIGKSSKEPMLAVRQLHVERFAGGILAVANNVANFSDNVGMVTVLGAQNSHEEFIKDNLDSRIDATLLYRSNSPTIVKRRLIEEYHFTKLLEVYEMNDGPVERADNEDLCAALRQQVPQYDVVMVVDFGHGMISEEAMDVICSASRFLALNSQSNAGNLGYNAISKYTRADFVCMSEDEIRLETRDRQSDLKKLIVKVSETLQCGNVVVTQGKGGCSCYNSAEGFYEVPAVADHVVDRMGSGDAFLSVAALCVAQQAPIEMVGFIGNVVGAEAVATVGHRTSIQRVPLIRHIQTLLK